MYRILVLFFVCQFLFSCNFCEFFGSKNLDGKFSILYGDKPSDRILVHCTSVGKCCNSGISLIPRSPSNPNIIIDGFNQNNRWIIIRSKDRKTNTYSSYWVLDKNISLELEKCNDPECRSNLKMEYIFGPMSEYEFDNKKNQLHIELEIDDESDTL